MSCASSGGASHWQDARYYLRDLGCDTTIISLGADGALLITAEGEFHFPAPRVDVVDTTGAGDAFVGGLLFTLSRANCWNHALLAGGHQQCQRLRRHGGNGKGRNDRFTVS